MSSFTGGKLRLKGGAELPGVKKKKKRPSGKEVALVAGEGQPGGSGSAAAAAGAGADGAAPDAAAAAPADRRTDAERRAEEHARRQEAVRIKAAASKSHRERIRELNEKLASLTEHHDIPRISFSHM